MHRVPVSDGQHRPWPGAKRACQRWLMRAVLCLAAGQGHGLDPDKALHHYVVDAWKLDAGLPQVQVTTLTQGPQGYMWVGTRGGLARFDGVSFRTYVPDNTPELKGMIINALYRDDQHRLWIGTYKGVTVYQDGRFRALPLVLDEQAPEAQDSIDVRGFAALDDGTVLVATDRGLLASRGSDLKVWRNATDPVHAVMVQDGTVWAGEVGRVRLFAGTSMTQPMPQSRRSAMVRSLVAYHGTIWAGTSRGLLRWNGNEWSALEEPGSLADSPVESLFVDRDGVLWVAASDGLLRFQGNRQIPEIASAAPHPGVQAIAEDHEGNLWLGSDTDGLARLRNGWTSRFSTPEGLHEATAWSLQPDADGAIWVGTTQGLSRFADGRFELVVPAQALPHPSVYTLLVEPDRIWLGTPAGLAVYRDGQVEIPAGTESLGDAKISSIVRDAAGGHWLATSKGLCRYRGPELRCFAREAGLRDPRLRFVFLTRDERLLVGSQGGLFEFVDQRFRPLGTGVISPDDDITAINQLADGTLVVGSLSEALYLNDGSGWHKFTHADGLPISSPFFSALDAGGDLWVAGLQGLYRVPLTQLAQRRRGEIDQVDARMLLNERGDVRGAQQTYCCNGAGGAKGFMQDGTLWLPTRDGIIAVETADVRANPHPPNVVIERVRLGGVWQDYGGQPIELQADARDLAVRFTALSFQAPDSVHFQYRLQGFDERWQAPDDVSRRTAFYTNLPPGEFEFQVKAANNAEVWQELPATLRVRVQPFFYETMAFYVLVAVLLVVVFYAGYRFLLHKQRRQRERLRALVEARTEELRIANEHLRDYSRRLEEASRTDPLTGLWNRRHLEEQLPTDLALFKRELERHPDSRRVKAFAVLDLDRFKDLNDRHGHGAGDQVLREFSALVSALVRPGDYVVRWGGEEFVIVLRDLTPESAEEVLCRILNAVARHPFRLTGREPLHITCSMGYAFFPFQSDRPAELTWEQTIEIADRALYAAKEAGRGRCVGFQATGRTILSASLTELRHDTTGMLASGQLERREFVAETREVQ